MTAVGSATSSPLYSYQTTLQSSGQPAAVLQVLTQAYQSASSGASSSDTDPLAALAGASAIGALAVGVNTVSRSIQAADGTPDNTMSASAFPATYGGMSVSSAQSLLAGVASTSDTSGLQGFGSGIDATASLAVAAYQAQQEYGTSASTGTSAGSAATSNGTTGSTATSQTGTGSDATTAALLQAMSQTNLASTLNLLA
jgi:hypothetical protein